MTLEEIWTDENKYRLWLDIEIMVCKALATLGQVPFASVRKIESKGKIDIERIKELEKETHHEMVAFLSMLSEQIGEDARHLHMGLTSSDVIDTALSVMMRNAANILMGDLHRIATVIHDPEMREATWRHWQRMKEARDVINVGKISGAVGTYAQIDLSVEAYVCSRLSLEPAKVSNQILQRDRHAQYLTTIALIGSSMERSRGDLSVLLRRNALAALEDITLWHERDISHSSVERIIIADSTIGLKEILDRYYSNTRELIEADHEAS